MEISVKYRLRTENGDGGRYNKCRRTFIIVLSMRAGGRAVFFLLLEAAGDSGMPSLCCGAVVFSAHLSQVLGLAVGTETYTSELRILQGQ